MNIIVVGTGYVGLISGLCLSLKHNVRCLDINNQILEDLNNGKAHIYEDGLQDLLLNQLNSGNFKCISYDALNLSEVDIIIFCIGTPSLINGDCDLTFLKSSIKGIIPFLTDISHPISLVVKSTVPPNTVSEIITPLVRNQLSETKYPNIGFGMNPEFLREGSAIEDFKNPDRIVLGYDSEISKEHLKELYRHFDCPKLFVSTSCAEMIKYVNNSLLALQISAVNEYANICQELNNVDIDKVMEGVLMDKRWQNNEDFSNPPLIHSYLKAGCGFGGSCFPKDVKALSFAAKKLGISTPILDGTISINNEQPNYLVKKLSRKLSLSESKILLLGITFKPNTDDIRESPTLEFIKSLYKYRSKIYVHDPIGIQKLQSHITSKFLDEDSFCEDYIPYLDIVDAIILITPWNEYLKLPLLLKTYKKIIFDTRGIFDASDFPSAEYLKVGLK